MFKPIRFVPRNARLPIIRSRLPAFALSALLVIGSLIAVAVIGLNFGIDFKGGILMEVRTTTPANISQMRTDLNALNFGEVSLQEFGDEHEVLIRIQRQEGDEA